MRNSLVTALLVASGCALATPAMAKVHPTVSVGYVSASLQADRTEIAPGANATLLLESDNGFGAVVSGVYARKSIKADHITYGNIMVGPSYRFLDYFALYAEVGVGFDSTGRNYTVEENNTQQSFHYRNSKAGFGYGVGIMINPINNFAINLAYNGSSFSFNGLSSMQVNSWIVGIGYKF